MKSTTSWQSSGVSFPRIPAPPVAAASSRTSSLEADSSNWSTRLSTALECVVLPRQGVDGEDDPAGEVEGRRDLQLAAVVGHQPMPVVAFPQGHFAGCRAQGGMRNIASQSSRKTTDSGCSYRRRVHRQRRAMSREDHRLDTFFLQRRQHDPRFSQSATAAVDAKTVRHPACHETDMVGKQPLPFFKAGRRALMDGRRGAMDAAGAGAAVSFFFQFPVNRLSRFIMARPSLNVSGTISSNSPSFPPGPPMKNFRCRFRWRASSFADQRRACTVITMVAVNVSASSPPRQ